jgi:hypothetical protein
MSGLEQMRGHLLIDGVDVYDELGFIVSKGSMEDWVLFPERKQPFTHDWRDENGIEVDLEHVYLKEKKVSLKVYFVADSEIEFWGKYKKTLDLLTSPGARTVYYRAMSKEFSVYYTRASSPVRKKGTKDVNQIIFGMTIEFVMPDPLAVVDLTESPTAVTLTVGTIYGSGVFSYNVLPSGSSQSVRVTITVGTGMAYVAGNKIYATEPGTVTVRVTSTVDSTVYTEKTITVYPDSLLHFADYEYLTDGIDYISEY